MSEIIGFSLFLSDLFHCACMETMAVSFSGGLDREEVPIDNGILLIHEKNEMLLLVTTRMDPENVRPHTLKTA